MICPFFRLLHSVRPINQRPLAPTRRYPLTAFPRLHLANIHGIDLLQRPVLRLAHLKIYNQHSVAIAAMSHLRRLTSSQPSVDHRSGLRFREDLSA